MRIKLLFLLPSLITFSLVAQDFVPVISKTRSATVYLHNAELKNTATVNLRQGTNYLVFTNLSPFVDANSIKVAADRDITITGVNLRTNYLDDAALPENFRVISTRLKEAEFNLQLRKSFKKVYEEERSLLLANKQMLGGDSKLTVEDLVEVANIYRTRLKEIEVKILEIEQEEVQLAKEVEKIKAQMGDRQNNLNQNRNEIEVTVVSKAPVSATFDLSYLVFNAGWAPAYEIRTDDNTGNVKLIYKANVFQSTAIDWNDVMLTLSTGNPAIGGTQPRLDPDYVDYQHNVPVYKSREQMIRKDEAAPALMDNASGMSQYTTVSEGNMNVYFDIAIPYNIPSTNRPMGVEIQQYDLTADYQHLAIPKLDRGVFLVAAVKGWEKLNLLPAQANVYYKNSYVGQSFIDPAQTKDKLEVSLGRDNGVVVEKKDLNEINKNGNLLGGNKKTFHYKFSIKNTKQRAINIRIEDQLPLSRNKDIEVEHENLGGGQLNAETGIINWNLALQPGETREFELKYSIKFPKGERINR